MFRKILQVLKDINYIVNWIVWGEVYDEWLGFIDRLGNDVKYLKNCQDRVKEDLLV